MTAMKETQDLKAQMIATLLPVNDYLKRLVDGCGRISRNFREGEKERGQALLADFLEGIAWVSEALELSQPVLRDHKALIDLGRLNQALGPAIDALENRDYGLTGDVFEYEVRPVLKSWTLELSKIPTA